MNKSEKDHPDGKDYYRFGGLQYKAGRSFDGIERTPGALTTEQTYRLFHGDPEIYLTCLYRWSEAAAAGYIAAHAAEFGKRLEQNKLLLPHRGCEEQFWQDAREILTAARAPNAVLQDQNTYLLISGVNPQLLMDGRRPFLLCDISRLTSTQLVAFVSKLLDLFNGKRSGLSGDGQSESVGKAFLSGRPPESIAEGPVNEALAHLAEVMTVLDQLPIAFCCFQWSVDAALLEHFDRIRSDPTTAARLGTYRTNLTALDDLRPDRARGGVEGRCLFLCHRVVDKALVRSLAEAFSSGGLSVWFDEAEMRWGDGILSKVADGVTRARYVVICVGASFRSGNCAKYELELALEEEVRLGRTKVLPLLLTTNDTETESLLEQIPPLRHKHYRTLKDGIPLLVQELKTLCHGAG